jgi:hypothetical protein
MASAGDWASAYLRQAAADLRASHECGEPSVRAMLIQMVLEKLAKAALLRGGRITVTDAQRTHAAAGPMVRVLDKRSCRRLGWNHDTVKNRLAPIVEELERAQPAMAQGGPCLEYPWLGPDDSVRWPDAHLPLVQRFRARSADAILLMNFAVDLHRKFDQVFA